MKDLTNKSTVKTRHYIALALSVFAAMNLFFILTIYFPLPIDREKTFKILFFCQLLLISFISFSMYKLIKRQSELRSIEQTEEEYISGVNTVLNRISEGIMIIDNKARIKSINEYLCRLLSIDMTDIFDKNLYNILAEYSGNAEKNVIPAMIIESLETDIEYKQQERFCVKDEDIIYFELSTHILRNKLGKKIGVLTVVRDIGQRKKLEQQLLHVEKLATAGQMAAEIAHEIKNPVCSIKGLLQVMGKKHLLAGSKYYETITKELDRITVLLQDFLSLTHIGTVFEKTDICEIIEDILPLAESQAVSKNIAIHIDIQKDLPKIYCDRECIRKVFVNIVQNAIDSLQKDGKLHVIIWCDKIKEKLKVEFRDNGEGIREEHINRIFDPFFTTKQDGSGLGLAISHRIVENHKGKLYALNNQEGGATFTVELPLLKYQHNNE